MGSEDVDAYSIGNDLRGRTIGICSEYVNRGAAKGR